MRLLAVLLVFICIFLTGCLPINFATKVEPVTGAILKSEPDTSVIRVGVTTRAEITQQFAALIPVGKGNASSWEGGCVPVFGLRRYTAPGPDTIWW